MCIRTREWLLLLYTRKILAKGDRGELLGVDVPCVCVSMSKSIE